MGVHWLWSVDRQSLPCNPIRLNGRSSCPLPADRTRRSKKSIGSLGAAPAQAVKGGSGSGVLAIFGFAGRHAVMGSVRRRRGRFRLGLPFLTPEEELLAEVGAGLWRDRQTLLGARRRRIGSQFGANRDIEPPPIVPRDRSRLQFTPNHRPRARGWALDALVALRIGSTMRVSYRPCGRSAPRGRFRSVEQSGHWGESRIGEPGSRCKVMHAGSGVRASCRRLTPCKKSRRSGGVGSRAVTRSDQRKLCTKYCLNDRLNCVEGRPQGTLDVEPLGHEFR